MNQFKDNETPIVPIDVNLSIDEDMDENAKNKPRKKSLKTGIYNAYQHVQRRFKETYAS